MKNNEVAELIEDDSTWEDDSTLEDDLTWEDDYFKLFTSEIIILV